MAVCLHLNSILNTKAHSQFLQKHAGKWQCPPKTALVRQNDWCYRTRCPADAGLSKTERIFQIFQLELELQVLEYTVLFQGNQSYFYFLFSMIKQCIIFFWYPVLQKSVRSCKICKLQDRMSTMVKMFSRRLNLLYQKTLKGSYLFVRTVFIVVARGWHSYGGRPLLQFSDSRSRHENRQNDMKIQIQKYMYNLFDGCKLALITVKPWL